MIEEVKRGDIMDLFDAISGLASIFGFVISVISLIVSSCTLYKIKKIDESKTENNLNLSSIGGDFVGRDRM